MMKDKTLSFQIFMSFQILSSKHSLHNEEGNILLPSLDHLQPSIYSILASQSFSKMSLFVSLVQILFFLWECAIYKM